MRGDGWSLEQGWGRKDEARSIALQLGVLNSSFGDDEGGSFDFLPMLNARWLLFWRDLLCTVFGLSIEPKMAVEFLATCSTRPNNL